MINNFVDQSAEQKSKEIERCDSEQSMRSNKVFPANVEVPETSGVQFKKKKHAKDIKDSMENDPNE
jgi:hypothetical protein